MRKVKNRIIFEAFRKASGRIIKDQVQQIKQSIEEDV
jgi:hypothetical protein